MGRLKISALLGAAVVALPSAAAFAADMPGPAPTPISIGGSWYLRGHLGLAQQSVDHLDNALFAGTPNFRWLDTGNFDAAPIFGGGIGYRFNDHLRFDVTGEYRGKAAFSALDAYGTGAPPAAGTNDYTAKKSEITLLANAYLDLVTWGSLTPYIGAGIGASYNTISDFRDVNVPNGGVAYGATYSQWSLAWAGHAGLAMKVNDNLTLDFGYSYTDLGDARSGDLTTYQGTNNIFNPMIFKHLTSQDFKIGARWSFGGPSQSDYYPTSVKY